MTTSIPISVYDDIFRSLPVGLILLDQDYRIIAWNAWMELHTKHKAADVHQKTLQVLYPQMNYARLDWALQQIFSMGAPQVLSQALNQYLIPIPINEKKYSGIRMMQQHVDILPIANGEQNWLALMIIKDVSSMVHQRNVLMELGHRLEEETFRDALTGIYNRRYLVEFITREIAQATRHNYSIACLMFDIDHFKRINDKYGHDVGDKVLLNFTEQTNCLMRVGDVFSRYGGEEFILLMPHTTADGAMELASRVCKNFENNTAKAVGMDQPVTCSVGIAMWDPNMSNVSRQDLITRADAALYAAKKAGRNCIKIEKQ